MAIDTISGKATAGPGRDLALPAHLQPIWQAEYPRFSAAEMPDCLLLSDALNHNSMIRRLYDCADYPFPRLAEVVGSMGEITKFDPCQSPFRFRPRDESNIAGCWRVAFRVRSSGDKPSKASASVSCSDNDVRVPSLNAIQRPVEASKAAPNIDISRPPVCDQSIVRGAASAPSMSFFCTDRLASGEMKACKGL
jgi:hypothetical protein